MIYHCGINGVFEAIYHGIPVICIPIQGDQRDNAKRLEVKGVGLQLELSSLTSHVLVEAVNTLLEDKRYALIYWICLHKEKSKVNQLHMGNEDKQHKQW